MSNNPLSFKEFLKKYSYKRSDEIIAYELYLIVQYLKRMLNMEEEKSIKKEELIQNELTKVRLIEANERLKEIAMKTEYEKEDYADKYCNLLKRKFSDDEIKKMYADLQKREYKKHCNNGSTFTSKIKKEVK